MVGIELEEYPSPLAVFIEKIRMGETKISRYLRKKHHYDVLR